ncbi:MAG: ABC transporter permease [Minisyncoccia bacterium]
MHIFNQAIRGLTASKSRTALTMLGIVIGIAVVVLVVSAGEGFKSYINTQVDQIGTNTITIQTQVPPDTKRRANGSSGADQANQGVAITTLKKKDVTDISRLPNVVGVYGLSTGQVTVSYDNVIKSAYVMGADAERFDIDKGVIAKGRGYTKDEDRSLAQVAVLGSSLADNLFGLQDPLGKTIRVGDYSFSVVGVYAPKGGLGGVSEDDEVFIPASTLQKKILGIDYYFYLIASLADNTIADTTSADIADVLRSNHNIKDPTKDDFKVQTQEQNVSTFATILSAAQILLLAIAAISLLVGGVGVMNIMYVVVTERTAEVGLKKALGATNRKILFEFLIEAVLLTFVGGIVGVLFGALLAYGVARGAQAFGFAWSYIVPVRGVVVAMAVSCAIGIGFGVFPARNAAKLNPIEALRYE